MVFIQHSYMALWRRLTWCLYEKLNVCITNKVRGVVLVTVPLQISIPLILPPFSCQYLCHAVNITKFCLPINPAPNECV